MNHHQHTHQINALVSPVKRILIAITLRTNFLAFHHLFEYSMSLSKKRKKAPTINPTRLSLWPIIEPSGAHLASVECSKIGWVRFSSSLASLIHGSGCYLLAARQVCLLHINFTRISHKHDGTGTIQLNDPNRRAMHCIRNTHKNWNEMFIIGLHIKANSTMFFFFWMQWTRKISIN